METKLALSEQTIEAVDQLIKINADSHFGFLAAADAIGDDATSSLFRRIAQKRMEHVEELQKTIDRTDKPKGSFKGALHRWWLDLRARVADGDRYTVLAEAERGEDEIKARYEKLLKEIPGNPLSDVLHRQLREVKTHHDMIRDMRDRAKRA